MFARVLLIVAATFIISRTHVSADIYFVTTTDDNGSGSLYQAIMDANAHPNTTASNPDRIHFAIPGTDVHTIAPSYGFPEITDPVVIDGFTQNGAVPNSNPVGQGLNAILKIELDGNNLLQLANGLTITAGNTTVRGLIINRFDNGIKCIGGSGNIITGNFIGTDRTGTFVPVITLFGRYWCQLFQVILENCGSSRVGGRDPDERNLISGSYLREVLIIGPNAIGNVVEGNLISTKADGMSVIGGGTGGGVTIDEGASSNLIGGTSPGARNVISGYEWSGGNYVGVGIFYWVDPPGRPAPFANLVKGNFIGLNVTGTGVIDHAHPTGFGVLVDGYDNVIGGTEPGARNIISGHAVAGIIVGSYISENNRIEGNFIGTDASGAVALGNGGFGIDVQGLANHNVIGGTLPGAGNRIAFNTFDGIAVQWGNPTDPAGNAILGNSIYGNGELGIDLANDGATPNDSADTDIGPNNLQNHPILTLAEFVGDRVRIQGTLESVANRSYRIEFFGDTISDPSNYGEGKIFLGAATISTAATGTVAFDVNVFCPPGTRVVSSTATDPAGNTSEFSPTLSIGGTRGAQLMNISTRLSVQTAENVLIGGFIITGVDSKRVLIRAIGPSLSASFSGVLPDPTLGIFQGLGLLAINDNWRETQQSEIEATGLAPTNDLESAIILTLPPGSYTAVTQGQYNTTGIGLVEVYDLDQTVISELANISTRGLVGTGDNVMIGGLIVRPDGGESTSVVVRALGPSLSNFGITGALQDPTLDLVNSEGGVIRSNNNWRESQEAELIAAGLQPGDDRESALIQIVPPGNYTAIVRGSSATTGVALVEVYHLE